MVFHFYDEDSYEQSVLDIFKDLGYTYYNGYEIDRNYHSPLFDNDLNNIYVINNDISDIAIETAIKFTKDFGRDSLIVKNDKFMDYLQNGIAVNYWEDDKEKSDLVKLVDWDNIENNKFSVINQWTFVEKEEIKRPDIVVFINGFPIVVMELKSPAREDADVSDAYNQLQNYMKVIPSLFIYNAFCVISDMSKSKAGTITSPEDRFMEWKTTDGDYESTQWADYNTFFKGMFEKNRFIDILKNFILFSKDGTSVFKILCGYHQYFAVNKAVSSTLEAIKTDGRAGVFWHTQGSGKKFIYGFLC